MLRWPLLQKFVLERPRDLVLRLLSAFGMGMWARSGMLSRECRLSIFAALALTALAATVTALAAAALALAAAVAADLSLAAHDLMSS